MAQGLLLTSFITRLVFSNSLWAYALKCFVIFFCYYTNIN